MKLRLSHYIQYLANFQIAADTPQDYYYHLRSTDSRVTDYKRYYDDDHDDQIKCFRIYKNASILFLTQPIINVI